MMEQTLPHKADLAADNGEEKKARAAGCDDYVPPTVVCGLGGGGLFGFGPKDGPPGHWVATATANVKTNGILAFR